MSSASNAVSSGGWRRWVPWVLVVLAAIIGLLASLNIWVKRQALSTDNWTNASSRLLENEDIRNAISVYIVDQIYANVDVGQELENNLPPRAKALGPPLAAAIQPAAIRIANEILANPKVQALWKEANRRAHQLFMAVIDGKHNLLTTTNGNVVLDLRPILEQVVQRTGFGERLLQRLPPDAGQLTIMKGTQLETARKAVKAVRVLSYFLYILVIALFALAIYLGRGNRRRLLMGVGASVLMVGLLILVVRRFAGNYIVDALTNNPDAKKPIDAAWAIGTELLRNIGVNALIYGVVVMFAAWVAGPSRAAVWARRTAAPTLRERPYITYGVVTLALLGILLLGPTDKERIIPLLILFAFAYLGTEVLRRQTAREFPPERPVVSAPPVAN